MPFVVYTLDDAILDFFKSSGVSVSRAECDDFARQRYGDPIQPVALQGVTSYTVTAGPDRDNIIQFRLQESALNMAMVSLARRVHGDLVPRCTHLDWLGNGQRRLAVYEMGRLHGENYILVRAALAEHSDRQLAMVHSLARFFAQAWRNSVDQCEADRKKIFQECSRRLEYLSASGYLSQRLSPVLAEVTANLPSLFAKSHPLVLTHGDLNEMNILINRTNGCITGVVDWAEGTILPFGFALYALENALGSMGPQGWRYVPNVDDLRSEFWTEFGRQTGTMLPATMQAVRVARSAGILFRYGMACNTGFDGMIGVRDPGIGCQSDRYLDAFLV